MTTLLPESEGKGVGHVAPAAGCAEEALVFGCAGETLVGVLSPGAAGSDTGLVIVVGGPQYRAGSHRQFVLLARSLAVVGIPVLRFDVRGMGDGSGAQRGFEQIDADIGAAIDALQARLPTVARVALWGLCDGAAAALLYCDATRDHRVAGLVLLNPWVRSVASLARTHVRHYYLQRLLQPAFWRKLLGGGVTVAALGELVATMRAARGATAAPGTAAPGGGTFQDRMARAWAAFPGSLLLVLSGRDYTAREFTEYTQAGAGWKAALAHPRLLTRALEAADHTFSDSASRRAVEALTLDWLATLAAPAGAAPQAGG